MNPLLIILIFIGGGLLWLLCSFLFKPLGKIFKKLFDDAKEAMSEETETKNEKESVEK